MENHDFRLEAALDWGRSFHAESVELCLNLRGRGEVAAGDTKAQFCEATAGYYVMNRDQVRAERRAREHHRFITIELAREFLARWVAGCEARLPAPLRSFVEGSRMRGFATPVQPLGTNHEALALTLCAPPVGREAQPLWYQAKTLELIAHFLFQRAEPEELFCTRQHRVARDRAEGVKSILLDRIENPPSLEELGRAGRHEHSTT